MNNQEKEYEMGMDEITRGMTGARTDICPIKQKITQHLLSFGKREVRLGVGCAWFGRQDDFRETLDHDLCVLMACYEKGFRYYDTSRQYGNSEQSVGEFVKHVPRESIFLATKSIFPVVEGTHKRDFKLFTDNFYESFERLQTDHIDLFQIHETNHFECCVEEVIPFLLERKREGLISYIGTGMLSLNAHELAIRSGQVNSVLSYLNYSLLKKSASHVIDVCRELGAAFVNASVFNYGLLRAEDPMKHRCEYNPPHMARNREMTVSLQALCRKQNVPILAAALQYSLLNPDIDMTLVGINRMENLVSTFESLSEAIHPEHWAEIFALQEKQPYMYVQDDLQV
jgi:aryl-alcohol dehydrogenase-like predicted oxidoreductase